MVYLINCKSCNLCLNHAFIPLLQANRPLSSSGRRSAGGTGVNMGSRPQSKAAPRDLMSREEEYMRLNAELEAKTAGLIQEAEDVMREQEEMLSRSLNRLSFGDAGDQRGMATSPIFDTEPPLVSDDISKPSSIPSTNLASDRRPPSRGRPPSANVRPAPASARPLSAGTRQPSAGTRQQTSTARAVTAGGRPASKAKTRPRAKAASASAYDDVAIPDDGVGHEGAGSSMGVANDFSLADTIHAIEGRLDDGTLPSDTLDDVLPQAAEGMGSEATIRFLKAKLRVMQEEVDRLSHEYNKKDEQNSKLDSRLKEAEEERARLQRTNTTQQTQIDKYKKLSEDTKRKSDGLEGQLASLRKEVDSLKRNQKQSATSQGAVEVRLNRAQEEADRYKAELQKARTTSRESTEQERKRVEQLLAENRRLEKQKNELMSGFKKQLKLIDVLKRQKMHIEAAKMLSFTEEEFVKALEWGN
ncbi:testis-expressed protein 9-like [Patiria miniata]|uniref:Testis-expressed sequence 9 protein n=1 Tax=Patiria miniata TaxID=46514 RepID=A0A914A3U7_PATMI|nr:testis-expressed protein 9-like [Patiria miniata]